MRALTDQEILSVWERGLAGQPATRAWLLLSAVGADTPLDQLAQLPIGQRDARLLDLREQTFGPQFSCLVSCPVCREDLECNLSVADLLRPDEKPTPKTPLPLPVGEGDGQTPSFSLQAADYRATFRLPTSEDLVSLSPQASLSENRHRLFRSCLLSASRNGQEIAADELPPQVTTAVVNRMAELDPGADLQLRLDCPGCGHRWEAAFDIVAFLWAELHAVATRLLREVHELASAYAWREADILAMTPQRRQAYLEMLRS